MKILLQLFSLKLIANLLGLVYSILQVRYFGASRIIEVYFAAQTLIYLVTSITQSGQLAEVFLPEYHKLNQIRPKLGFKGLNVIISYLLVVGVGLILLFFLVAPWLIDLTIPGFSDVDKDMATLIFRIILPIIILQVLNSFFVTVLNADEHYGRAEFLSFTNTVLNIITLVILYPSLGIWAMVISLMLGRCVEFVFYWWQMGKLGYSFQVLFRLKEFDHLSFFKIMKSTFLYVGATQIYSIVLVASVSFLPEGIYAIFKYVQNLASRIRGVFIQPFLTLFFTKYSLIIRKSKNAKQEFIKYAGSIIHVNSLLILGSILLGDYFLELIWGGSKFDTEAINLAYIFLLFNIGGVLMSSVGSVYRKMAVALGKARQLYLLWVIAQLLSALAAYFLISNYGTNGLFTIIPINMALMAISSYYVYKRSRPANNYSFFNVKQITSLIIIAIAISVKYLSINLSIFDNKTQRIIFLILVVLGLSLKPLLATYNLFKKKG